MAGNKTVYTLDLDTSKLISKYKDAISQMEKAGVSGDITKGLTQGLEKLEKEYKSLETAGKAGFTNSKQIENFQKRVEKLMTSFRGFETELDGVGEKIGKIAKKSEEANKKLSGAFSKFGFKDVAKQMDAINNATDREAKLSEIVKTELQARAKAVADLKTKYDQAAQAAQQAAQKANSAALGTNQNSKYSSGESVWTSGKNKVDNSVKQTIVEQAKAIAKAAKDGEAAWAEFNNYLKTNGLDKAFNQRALPQLEQSIKDMQAGFSAAAPAIEQATKAQEELNAAEESFNQIGKNTKNGLVANREVMNQLKTGINEVTKAEEEKNAVMDNADATIADLTRAQKSSANAANEVAGAATAEETAIDSLTADLNNTVVAAEKTAQSFEQLKSKILMFFSITSIFNSIRNEIKKTYEDVKTLDKSFASIAMVTKYSVNEMWSSYSLYADMASQLGQKTNDVIQASALFYQQGLDTNEALALTTDTMKLATLAGTDFSSATQEMTSAIRGFKMEMDEGNRVADVYSNLAAHAAATVDDIAQAMARTASIANSAGMSFENTSAFLTQMIETTQESAENIGTSLKTIIARFTELKENVAGTADSEFEDLDYNKVDKALKSVGVSLKDATGQFRNLDEVFMELSQKWDSLDRNTQRYVATIAAGSRQQSRFIAMMDNYERTAELMDYAANAEGKADEQFAKYADTMEYKLNQLSTKWEEFRVQLLDSEAIKSVVDLVGELLDRVSQIRFDNAGQIIKNITAIGFAIKNIKTIIMTMLSNTANIIKTAKKTGEQIGSNLISGVQSKLNKKGKQPKLQIRIDEAQKKLQTFTKQIENSKKKYGQNTYEALVQADTEQLAILDKGFQANKEDADKLAKTLDALGYSTEDYTNALREAARQGVTISELGNRFKNMEQEVDQATMKLNALSKAQSAVGSLASTAFSSAVTSISMVATGAMSAKEGMESFLITMGMMATQTAIQIGLDWALAAAKAKGAQAAAAKAAADGAESAGNLAVAASAATATAAEYAMLWPLLLIVGALGAVAIGAAIFMKKMKKSSDETKDFAETLDEANKSINEAASNKSSEALDLSKSVKDAKALRDEYIELSNKAYLTAEEEQRYSEVMAEINEQFPQIVQYYDEVNNKLIVANDLWDDILEKQGIQATQAKKDAKYLELSKISLSRETDNEKIAAAQRAKDERISTYEDILDVLTTNVTGTTSYGAKETGSLDYLNKRAKLMKEVDDSYYDVRIDLTRTVGEDDRGVQQSIRQGENAELILEAIAAKEGEESEFYKKVVDWTKIADNTQSVNAYNYFSLDELNTLTGDMKDYLEAISADTGAIEEETKKKNNLSDRSASLNAYAGLYSIDHEGATNTTAMLAGAITQGIRNQYDFSAKAAYDAVDEWNENSSSDQFWYGSSAMDLNELRDNKRKGGAGTGKNKYTLEDGTEVEVNDSEVYRIWTEVLGKTADDWKDLKETERAELFMPILLEEKLQNGDIGSELSFDALDSATKNKLETLYTDVINKSGSDASVQAFRDYLEQHPEITIDEEALLNPYIQAREKINQALSSYGFNNKYDNLGTGVLSSMTNHIDEQIAKGVSKSSLAELYSRQLAGLTTAEQETMIKTLNSIDYSEVNIGNIQQTKNAWVKAFKAANEEKGKIITDEEADKAWKEFFAKAQNYNTIDLKITSKAGLEGVEDAINTYMDGVVDSAESVTSILSKYSEDKFIDFSNYRKLGEELEKFGLNVKDFTTATKEGFTVDVSALSKAYQQQIGDKDYLIAQTQEAIDQGIEELDNEISLLDTLSLQKDANADIIKQKAQESKLTAEIAANMLRAVGATEAADAISTKEADNAVSYDLTDIKKSDAYISLVKQRDELKAIRNDKEKLLQYAGGDTANAALQQISKGFTQVITGEEDATKALDKMTDAAQKAADAYDDMIEKQEALNEKIKEYNELLYGKENRKSSLDVLYNYAEAINSFNDEISRSKELLADSKTLEESTAALTRYTQATHNLLVEEKAKQEVLKKGLANYEDIIESGTSYTDELTGNKIDVDFSEYVKKDARTNKYIIDQRLLNEAKFADTWKDYLEQQVSDYNKYSEELLKSEDEVRKKEKELEDERNSARKNYVAMEKEIADALKQQYQDEVDALQSKYDSMKDADDDYLNALQEAIDKQRKLRDQENAYEDLAKQEKKLSLMQRDTSGANALEVQNLEEDIQKSREDLLDEAIDNVIDGLSKLYESQEELRNEEMELKQALLDNTLYWNQQAENLAGSFENADEYAAYLSSISKEYADMTLTMQQDKLAEYGDTYTQATEYMAMISMDSASKTHDFINDTITTTEEEISQTVAETAETFSTEVIRAYNETTEAFNADMKKAKDAIDDANKALDEATRKYNECAQAANAAAEAYKNAVAAGAGGDPQGYSYDVPEEKEDDGTNKIYAAISRGVENSHYALDDITKKYEGQEAIDAMIRASYGNYDITKATSEDLKNLFELSGNGTDEAGLKKTLDILGVDDNGIKKWVEKHITDLGHDPNYKNTPEYFWKRFKSRLGYAQGGLVDFTGPAWVDGTPGRPEAFLSPEDTENIGNAAKILADIPWLDRTTSNGQVITNNGGDVSVEINLNIDHISSETDIDEMLERVKEEIVEVARPAGTNTILQQEI